MRISPRLAAVLVTATLLAACARDAGQIPKLKYEKFTLPNGLEVIIHEDHATPIAVVDTWYHVGSGDEKPGRTGFAHLFEHVMFMGSQNVPYGKFDQSLEAAGANNNGSTTEDRTNYFESGPSNVVPLALWLDADRMGWLLPTMDQQKLDAQRDVVKNERRQSVDNVPYGTRRRNHPRRALPQGPSVLVARHRLDDRPLRRVGGRREGVLPHLLRAEQRHDGHRRRRAPRLGQGLGHEVLRGRPAQPERPDASRR